MLKMNFITVDGRRYSPCIVSSYYKNSLITAAMSSNGQDLRPLWITEQPHLQNTLVGSFRFIKINGMIEVIMKVITEIVDFIFYRKILVKTFN